MGRKINNVIMIYVIQLPDFNIRRKSNNNEKPSYR